MKDFNGRVAAITGRRLGDRAGPGQGPGPARRPPGGVRHRRGRAGGDGVPLRGPRREGHVASGSTWPTGPPSTPGPTR